MLTFSNLTWIILFRFFLEPFQFDWS